LLQEVLKFLLLIVAQQEDLLHAFDSVVKLISATSLAREEGWLLCVGGGRTRSRP
jgi:hypothetical protein